jgi:hypothetical protein
MVLLRPFGKPVMPALIDIVPSGKLLPAALAPKKGDLAPDIGRGA